LETERGEQRVLERKMSLCSEAEDSLHILLKCSETRKWREQLLSSKLLIVNEEVAYKRIINCTNVKLRNIGKYLYKIRCKWANKISSLIGKRE
jgi:hypothetical protein